MLSESAVAVLTALILNSVEAEQPFPRTADVTAGAVEAPAQPAEIATPETRVAETARYRSPKQTPR